MEFFYDEVLAFKVSLEYLMDRGNYILILYIRRVAIDVLLCRLPFLVLKVPQISKPSYWGGVVIGSFNCHATPYPAWRLL